MEFSGMTMRQLTRIGSDECGPPWHATVREAESGLRLRWGWGIDRLGSSPRQTSKLQPIVTERGMVVTSARLDNRADLLQLFDVPAREALTFSDGHLVGLAFDRWGEELCAHLQGDWALAAWDRRERRLLLAKDAYGCETLYFHEGKGFIAFASSLGALLALPGLVREPDPLRLAQVLVSWQHDAERTAYKGFHLLLRAHARTIDADGRSRFWRYWSPDGRPMLRYRRDEEYEEAFLEHYARAVKSCLRTTGPVAAMLSGGRDSASMVALAAPLLASQGRDLAAYTSIPSMSPDGAGTKKLGNEWDLAHRTAAMAGPNVRHIAVDAAGYGVVQGIEHFLDVSHAPSHATANHFWLQAMAEAASSNGATVILTAHMGNSTVSWAGNGSALLALRQRNPHEALHLLLHAEANPWLTLKRQVLKPVLMPGWRWLRRMRTARENPWQAYSALHPRMALTLDLDGRMKAAGYDPTFTVSPLEDLRLRFFWPGWSVGTALLV